MAKTICLADISQAGHKNSIKTKEILSKMEIKKLRFDENNKSIVICMEFTQEVEGNVWATGTNNFKRNAIAKLVCCTNRRNTINITNALMPSTASTSKSLLALDKHVIKKLDQLFKKHTYVLAKKRKTCKDYDWLCDLNEAKEIPIGNTYKPVTIFVKHIDEVEKRVLRKKTKSAISSQ